KADNLIARTNGVLTEAFTADSLNQLSTFTRSNTSVTVGGLLNLAPQAGTMTVNGGGAAVYGDLSFATTNGVSLANGNNTFTNSLKNSSGQTLTQTRTFNLPLSLNFNYDFNGNLTN